MAWWAEATGTSEDPTLLGVPRHVLATAATRDLAADAKALIDGHLGIDDPAYRAFLSGLSRASDPRTDALRRFVRADDDD